MISVSKVPRSNHFLVCEACFQQENFPIFFSQNDFYEIVASDVLNLTAERGERDWTITQQTELVETLKTHVGIDNITRALQKRFPHLTVPELLQLLLRMPRESGEPPKPAGEKLRYNSMIFQQKFAEDFKQKLKETSKFLEDARERQNGEAGLAARAEHSSSQALEDAINKKIERINHRLLFFSEFEKIIIHEKLNIQLIK